MAKNFAFILLLSVSLSQLAGSQAVVGCYWGSWSFFRNDSARFTTDNIDGNLCTHVYYGFIALDNSTWELSFPDFGVGNGSSGYANFTALKATYPNTQFLVSIGGWNSGSYAFSGVVANSSRITYLLEQVLSFIDVYRFDGLDIAWDYPSERDTFDGVEDRERFVALLREARALLQPRGLLLTVAVGAPTRLIDNCYDIAGISDNVDLINFMTFDIHGSWDTSAGTNAPLFDPNSADNVDAYVTAWLNGGANASKLILGVPFFGISYTLADSSDTSYGAAVSGVGTAGPGVRLPGVLAYYEILANIEGGWSTAYNEDVQTPYAFSGDQWVGYDNPTSIGAKIVYACFRGLGGVMAWSLDFDDFAGLHGLSYPLLNSLNQINLICNL